MTLVDLFRIMLRRWPVIVLGALITLGCLFMIKQQQGVYWSRTEVVFLAPRSSTYPNPLATNSGSLIDTAGVVEKLVTGPGAETKYTSPDVNLVGTGVRDGWTIKVPDTGGQWASNFANREVYVEVVGPSAAEVHSKQDELVGRLQDALREIQAGWHVTPRDYVTMTVAPRTTAVSYVAGRKPRAAAMTLLLGGVGTAAGCVAVDRIARRRGRDRQPALTPTI